MIEHFEILPCWYCKYYYSYSSKCLKRITQSHEELEICPAMELDDAQVLVYKEYFNNIQKLS